jgi:hypothetical protein
MDLLISVATELWGTMAPTTWFLVLGLLISFSFLKKTLF